MTKKNLRLINFRVGPETFAADIMSVRQVVLYEGSTAVPSAPAFVEGVIIFRGTVVPVIDLHRRLFPQHAASAEQPLILITMTKSGLVGLKVDEVRTLANVTTDDLLPAPALVRGVRGEYLVAVVEVRDQTVLVLDLESILTENEQRELRSADLSAVPT